MHIIHTILFTLVLLFSFAGCGNDVTSTTSQETNNTTVPQSAKGIFTAGDDQNVLAGEDVTLSASLLDKKKIFKKIIWKEDGKVLGNEETIKTSTLSKGTHTITLEMVDSEGNLYKDVVTVTIKDPSQNNAQPKANDFEVTVDEDTTSTPKALSGSDSDGDKLSYLIIKLPMHGTLSGSYARLKYTPDSDYFGTDSFQYKTNDGIIDSNIATVSIMIESINDAPIAVNDTIQTDENTPLSFNVLQNDTDVDNTLPLRLTDINITESYITFSPDGNITFSPQQQFDTLAEGEIKIISLRYTITDEHNATTSAIATINIVGIDDNLTINPIVPQDANLSINDGAITGHISANDIDASTITYTLKNPLVGFDINTSGDYTYTPSLNDYIGLREGEVKILDIPIMINGVQTSLQVNIIGKNEAPVAIISSKPTAMQNVPITFDAQYSLDEDINDSMTYLWKLHENILSTKKDFNTSFATVGDYNITLLVTDEEGASDTTTNTIMISDGHPYMDLTQIVTEVTEDDLSISFGAIPVSGSVAPYTFIPVTGIQGFVQDNDGSFSFNTSGYQHLSQDSIFPVTMTFNMYGKNGLSDEQNITFNMRGINDAPVAFEDTNRTDEDSNITFNVLVNDSDVDDNHTLTLSSVNTPKGLVIFTTDGNITFSPDGDFDTLAEDSFENIELSYVMHDEYNATDTAKIQLKITGRDDAIVVQPLQITKIDLENSTQLDGTLKATDVDSPFQFIDNNTSDGFSIDPNTGNFTFTPSSQYSTLKAGEEQSVTISIMIGNTPHTLTFTIIGKNEAPLGEADTVTLDEDTSITIDVLTNDIDDDHDTLSISSFTQPSLGTVRLLNNKIIYTPKKDITGSDSFRYTPSDGTVEGNSTKVNITIHPINDTPIFTSAPPTTGVEGEVYSYTVTTFDPDNNETLTLSTSPSWLTLNGNTLSGPVPNGQTATYTVNLDVSDGMLSTNQNFTINVTSVNFPPSFTSMPIMIDTNEDNTSIIGTIVADANDIGDSITFTSDTNLTGFILDTNGSYTLDLSADFYQALAEDENFSNIITIKATDNAGSFVEQNLSLLIHGKNDTPSSETFQTQTNENTIKIVHVLPHIHDIDYAHQFTVTQTTASKGNVFVKNNKLIFSPLGYFDELSVGHSEFVTIFYTVNDEHNATVDANMTIKVNGRNDAPILAAKNNISIDEDSAHSADINASDLEGSPLSYDSNSSLLTINANGTYTIKTDSRFDHLAEGSQTQILIMISVSDGTITSTQELNVTIHGKNDAPIAHNDTYTLIQNQTLDVDILANDTDDDNGTIKIETLSVPSKGNANILANGHLYFQTGNVFDALRAGENEDTSFSYSIIDQYNVVSKPATITIHVQGKDDAPTASIIGNKDIQEGESLTLYADAKSIDANTSIQSHTWLLDGEIQSTHTKSITIQPALEGFHSLQLRVTDNRGLMSTTSINITVTKQKQLFNQEQTIDTYTNGNISQVALGDLDKDGDLDILVNARDKQILWYENKGNKTYTPHTIAISVPSNTVHIADINQDGFSDILYASDSLTICTNKQDKTFNCNQTINSGMRADDNISDIIVNDIDNDNDFDILTTSHKENTVNIFINNGNGTFAYNKDISDKIEGSISSFFTSKATLKKAISIDNYNSNLVVAGEADIIHLHKINGDGSFTKVTTNKLSASNPSSVSFAMLDHDSEADIIGATATGELFWYSKTQDNKHPIENFSKPIPYATGIDIDNDGYTDILTNTNASDGAIMWFKNDGKTTPTFSKQNIATKADITITQAGDLDNDGDIDIVTADKNGKLYIYTNNLTSNKIVLDELTHLMWDDNPNTRTDIRSFNEATNYCAQKAGIWRVPSENELKSISSLENIFTNFQDIGNKKWWWTSTVNSATEVVVVNIQNGSSANEYSNKTIDKLKQEYGSRYEPVYLRCVKNIQ